MYIYILYISMIMNVHPAQTWHYQAVSGRRSDLSSRVTRHWPVRTQLWGGASGQHREWPIDLEADRWHPQILNLKNLSKFWIKRYRWPDVWQILLRYQFSCSGRVVVWAWHSDPYYLGLLYGVALISPMFFSDWGTNKKKAQRLRDKTQKWETEPKSVRKRW